MLRHPLVVEAEERVAKRVPLAQDREPAQSRLEPFEADLLEQAPVVGDREAPLAIVIRDVERVVAAPGAARGATGRLGIRQLNHEDMGMAARTLALLVAAALLAARRRRGRAADLRRARPLQPRCVGKPAAEGRHRDPAQGGTQARARLELRRRGHAAARRRGARARAAVAASVSHARRCQHVGARRDGGRVPRGAAAPQRYVGDRRVSSVWRRRRPPGSASAWWRSRSSTSSSCTRIRTSTRSSACSARTRTRASCGRIPASTVRSTCATCCASTRTCGATSRSAASTAPAAKCRRSGARCSPRFPDRFMVGTDTFTPERWHYIVEHANWSRAWLADLPPALAERIAWRNGEALFAFWKPHRAAMTAAGTRRGPLRARPPRAQPCGEALAGTRHASRTAATRSPTLTHAGADPRRPALRRRFRGVPARGAPAPQAVRVDANMPEHKPRHELSRRRGRAPTGRVSCRRHAVPHARALGPDVRRRRRQSTERLASRIDLE